MLMKLIVEVEYPFTVLAARPFTHGALTVT